MSEFGYVNCDNPGCEEQLVYEEGDDEDLDELRERRTWISITLHGASEGEEETPVFRDFCSVACVAEWSKMEAWLA